MKKQVCGRCGNNATEHYVTVGHVMVACRAHVCNDCKEELLDRFPEDPPDRLWKRYCQNEMV